MGRDNKITKTYSMLAINVKEKGKVAVLNRMAREVSGKLLSLEGKGKSGAHTSTTKIPGRGNSKCVPAEAGARRASSPINWDSGCP